MIVEQTLGHFYWNELTLVLARIRNSIPNKMRDKLPTHSQTAPLKFGNG